MNALGNAVRGIRSMWGHGDEDDYAPGDDPDTAPNFSPAPSDAPAAPPAGSYAPGPYRADKTYSYGGGNSSAASTRRPRAVPMALRRDKNIYTLKPKNLEESAIAADHLKTGSAVVLNLDDVERLLATRIIDFMSGVCYGLDTQGHAMKLGDTIFLFTPGEFEISSDETDYGENREFFFKDVPPLAAHTTPAAQALSAASAALRDSRTWET